ncbi:lisH domain-containing protein ARMC9 isoform X2 [Osmia lignaria lignaria]|uniref:lisH domain-containing protein ARMC9 isoform X2 n=1 Tax=Osmia lignaria lignaria TaxID=1437193 RepID=UPI00402B0E2E
MDESKAINQMDNKELELLKIHQFLIDNNFENTADALMIEAAIKGHKNLDENLEIQNVTYAANYENMMLSYKTGDWRTFFKLWNLLVPDDAKQTRAYKILMLNLHVYFTMLPKRMLLSHCCKEKDKTNPSDSMISINQQDFEQDEHVKTEIEKNMNENMEQLCVFLNTEGKELENDIELRPFFALPFIEDPYAEPFLSKIFEQSWIDELRDNVQLFLNEYKPNFSDDGFNKFSSNQEFQSEELKKDIVAEKLTRDNIPIVPNDRNIPIFLEDGETGEQYSLCSDTNYNQKTKSIQTVSINSSAEEIPSSYSGRGHKKLLQCTQELALTQTNLCTVRSNYEKLKLRFHKLHADYHKLMSIARVLTTALENSVKGQSIDFQAMLETCIKIFPDLFNQNIRDSSHCSSEALSDKSRSDMNIVKHSMSYSISVPPKLLDFKKIKLHLINGSIKVKLFLLQALRRKITFGQPGERDETLHEYISKDLLGLHSQIASYKGKSILPHLLTPENFIIPHPLQQSVTRLLNTLASFRCGRDYLSFDSTVVDMVYKCLSNICDNNIDTVTCNMMIAMLQKLSLRKQQRLYMIENGLVEWLIHHLHDQCRIMDSYRLEYATALLMNLSLHHVAQKRASAMASLLISTLITLLLMDHASALPYVNGALNNFLTNYKINEEAKKMKFSSMLEQYSKYKTGEIRKHLDHILKIHKGEITIKTEDEEMADNDNEEFDVVESQLEENDPVKSNYGELCGEALLASCYTILRKVIQRKEMNTEVSSIAQTDYVKTDTINHSLQTSQVKNLCSEHEAVLQEDNFPRKHMKDKHNIMVIQDFTEKTILYPKSQSRVTKLISSSSKERISKQFTNKNRNRSKSSIENSEEIDSEVEMKLQKPHKRNKDSEDSQLRIIKDHKNSVNELFNESAIYLLENQCSKQNSKVTVTSSVFLAVGSKADSSVMEKLSSIASLNSSSGNETVNHNDTWRRETELDTEEAFLSRPKLPRTPP